MTDDTTPYCVEGCGRPAIAERLLGLAADGTEIVELVCYEHAMKVENRSL